MNGGHQCTHFLSVCGLWNHLSFSLLNMYILQVFTKVVCTFIPILYLEKCHSENFAFTLSRLAHFVSLNGLAPSKSDHFIPQHNHTLTLLDHSLSIETPAPLWLDHLLALNSHAHGPFSGVASLWLDHSFIFSNLQNLSLTDFFWIPLYAPSFLLLSHASVEGWAFYFFTNAFLHSALVITE